MFIYPEPNSGCWLWAGYSNQMGYGQVYVKGVRKQSHRLSYEIKHNILLTSEQLICHKCNVPSCCNPDHLYLGTQSDNMSQAYRQKRSGRTIYKEVPVCQIDLKTGDVIKVFRSIMQASRETGISQPNISRVIKGLVKNPVNYHFIPLSSIDEKTFERNYKNELV